MNFEQSFHSLEKLVEQIEHENLSLENLLTKYEQAQQLITNCQQLLESAQQRIEELSLPPLEGAPNSTPSIDSRLTDSDESTADDKISLF